MLQLRNSLHCSEGASYRFIIEVGLYSFSLPVMKNGTFDFVWNRLEGSFIDSIGEAIASGIVR